jgi:trimeric autotransporter adhesin
MKLRIGWVVVGFLSFVLSLAAQTVNSGSTSPQVPPLIQFANVATDPGGSSLSGVASITFSLFSAQQGGEPLWTETQNNIQLDSTGHYSVQLGITKPNGVPTTLFTTGEARWLGVRIAEQGEQPRVLLLSVPYALKAGDAATIGGLPPSAFVLAAPALSSAALDANATPQTSTPPPTGGPVTGTGTINYLPLWNSISDIVSSVIFQSGSGTTAKIGIGTTTPATTLDIKGGSTVRGILGLPATGTATATAGKNSQPLSFTASAYNGATSVAANQVFRWQAEPADNDKATPSGTLNLLFAEGTATPAETGLKIASDGQITFAAGQTFPGAGGGSGTVTSITAGTGLTGGTITTTGTLAIDTTKIPQLGAANIFTANQQVNGGSLTLISPGNSIIANTTGTSTAAVEANAKGSGANYGVYASTGSPTGYGVEGVNVAITGTTAGVYGLTSSPAGYGIHGSNSASTGNAVGVYGTTAAANGFGVYGSGATGVAGESTGLVGPGGLFTGWSVPSGSGLLSSGTDGADANGGNADPTGSYPGGNGVLGNGGTGPGGGGNGVVGYGGNGQPGSGADGMGGFFVGANSGSDDGDGVWGGSGSGVAGNFVGDVDINGTIYTGAKDFKIDHPLDPANKYLFHASVESSEMKNIYDGNVTTDGQGQATVQLPGWFEVLNTDFRYQLTVIGQFAQAIIGQKIENNQFEIRTSAPNVEVSWQVTGVRQDAYAKAHPLVVEQEKEARLQGFYLHPELYGAPAEKQIEWARHPQMMKRMKEMQARQLAAARKPGAQPVAPRD